MTKLMHVNLGGGLEVITSLIITLLINFDFNFSNFLLSVMIGVCTLNVGRCFKLLLGLMFISDHKWTSYI